MDTYPRQDIQYLQRPEGRIAYTVEGSGPLVVAVPGMGDLRSSYREIVPPLVASGYRVAVTDLRGHGTSDTSFHTHGDAATGGDIIALVDELGGPAVVLGSSMGGSAAVWAAAERADAVIGLVLYSAFLREPAMPAVSRLAMRLLFRLALTPPWGVEFWAGYYRSINRGTRAPWLDEHVADLRASLREPGRLRSLRELALQLDHSVVEERLDRVVAPIRVFIGSGDPDFSDPAAESAWIASIGGQSELVPDAGHYPHAQRPDITVPATIEFLDRLNAAQGPLARA
jgi:pimeloyl-ACP methyl ester carboxylesterase